MRNHPARRSKFLTGASRRLIGVFVLFILLPGALLGIFALRVLRQEEQFARQRTRERVEQKASEIGTYIGSEFRQWEEAVQLLTETGSFDVDRSPETISRALGQPGSGVVFSLTQDDFQFFPSGALLFVPEDIQTVQTESSRAVPPRLAAAESLEMERKDFSGAVRAYRNLLASSGDELRPLILQRLARTLRKAGHIDEAASTYRKLQDLDQAWIGGLPSDLIAASELCSLAVDGGDASEIGPIVLAFYRDLVDGKWLLGKPRYMYYSDRCRTWCQESEAAADEFRRLQTIEQRKLALSHAAEDFLTEPRRILSGEGLKHLAFWQNEPVAAVILSGNFLQAGWWLRILSDQGDDFDAALYSNDGTTVFGSFPLETPPFAVSRDLRIGGTPWLLQVWPGEPEAIYTDIKQKQTLSIAMLAFVVVLLIFGTYITIRIVRRELEIARLRADFVSTVSHEFRSPLTGIKQLGEMLLDGRAADEEKQRGYYRMIVQESDRLGRLVENVLDFSRMEEGRREYRFEQLKPTPWLRDIAADFEAETAVSGGTVRAKIPDDLPSISADSEALGSAVRNLLDNAVKYSPRTKKAWLEAEVAGGQLRIVVRDKGIGISEHDRRYIFDRFFRTEGETSKRIKGAGLGLSLVQHIVTAHGGVVECESRLGEGSTFTIRLPANLTPGGK